jgi:hypothetical protein
MGVTITLTSGMEEAIVAPPDTLGEERIGPPIVDDPLMPDIM